MLWTAPACVATGVTPTITVEVRNAYGLVTTKVFTVTVLPSRAISAQLAVEGTDVIFLAGRTDVTIPPLGIFDPAFPLVRPRFVDPDFLQETFPTAIPICAGAELSFSVSGAVHYWPNLRTSLTPYPPDGGIPDASLLYPLGGISGYAGPQGALVGVFLDDLVPAAGPAPTTLDFRTTGLTTSFINLSPALGQVFFIGDGRTAADVVQRFRAPARATRLFLGIPDGGNFIGAPGYYPDNDGAFYVDLSVSGIQIGH